MSDALAIPDPAGLDLAKVPAFAEQAVALAASLDDIDAVREVQSRWEAIAAYVESRVVGQRKLIETTKRRIEVRVGELLSQVDEGATRVRPPPEIGRREAQRLRKRAKHAATVEAVINESTEADPPTARKVDKALRSVAGKESGVTVSVTLRQEEVIVLDAVAAHLGASRAAVLSKLLARMKPSQELSPTASAWRQAHVAAFGDDIKPAPSTMARTRPAAPVTTGCSHSKWSAIGGGLRACAGCDAVRGPDGLWRAAQ